MIELNLDKLMDNYVSYIRFNSKSNKIFGKINNQYINDLNQKLGLTGSGDKINDCIRIVEKLITDYRYFGEYTYGPINAFLDIYSKAQRNNIIEWAKLQHLENNVKDATPIVKSIMQAINGGDKYYLATQTDINKFKNQKFIHSLAKQCAAEDQRRRQQKELEDQYQLQQLEDQERQQELDDQYRQYHIERLAKQGIFDSLSRTTPSRDSERILLTTKDLRPTAEQQQQQKYVDENNPVVNEPLQNDFLANKEMAQQPQAPPQRSHARIGMNELANIVLGMQRDFKRVANALSVQGATAIIDKHNENSPNAPWHLTNNDVNNDGIPDIIIRNANNEPIVVNGWTTKGSDYPERYLYYNSYPTREARRAHPYPTYKKNELYQIQYDENSPDIHRRGNVTAFNQQPFPPGWNTSKYNVNRNPGKRLSAYRRFQKLIANPILDMCAQQLIDQDEIQVNGQGKWKDKMSFYAQVTAGLWERYIINQVLRRTNMVANSKEFRKFKNSANGKQVIDNTVTEFYYHLHHTNGPNWTEEQRDRLQQDILHFAADELTKLVRHASLVADNAHVYPQYHEDVQPFNPETEGEFGTAWEAE